MKLYVLSLFETIRQINVHFPFSPMKKYGKTTDSLAFKKSSSDNLYFFEKSIVLIFFASFRLDCTYMLRRKLQFVNRCKIGLFYEHSVIPITCYAYMAVAVEFINFLWTDSLWSFSKKNPFWGNTFAFVQGGETAISPKIRKSKTKNRFLKNVLCLVRFKL